MIRRQAKRRSAVLLLARKEREEPDGGRRTTMNGINADDAKRKRNRRFKPGTPVEKVSERNTTDDENDGNKTSGRI